MTTPVQTTKVAVDPSSIVVDPDFTSRQYGLESTHVRTLAQIVRSGSPLDRVVLWRDPSTGANGLTLLDGAHRLAAYRTAGWSGPVPAMIVECGRKEALLRAAGANTKDRLGMSRNEKQDNAWKLVRMDGVNFSKVELAKATGVSPRNIVRMRMRWKALQSRPEMNVTGQWWRDQKDDQPENLSLEELTLSERSAAIREQAAKVRNLMDRRQGNPILADGGAVFQIIEVAFGTRWAEAFAEWTLGGADDAADFMTGDPDESEDENPDF